MLKIEHLKKQYDNCPTYNTHNHYAEDKHPTRLLIICLWKFFIIRFI